MSAFLIFLNWAATNLPPTYPKSDPIIDFSPIIPIQRSMLSVVPYHPWSFADLLPGGEFFGAPGGSKI